MSLECLFLLICTLVTCECAFKHDTFQKEPEFADTMCPLDQVDFQTVTNSAISCVRKCDDKPACKSLIYLRSNKTCFGIKSAYPFVTNSSLPGAMFYKANSSQTTTPTSTTTTTTTPPTTTSTTATTPTTTTTPPPTTTPPTTTTTPTTTTHPTTTATTTPPTTTIGQGSAMVSGLPDSALTASTYYSAGWAASAARFNNTQTTWSPAGGNHNTNQWIQVKFLSDTIVTHVLTKGRQSSNGRWVETYSVLTSTDSDCLSFAAIKDSFGTDQVFTGNTDRDTEVKNALEPPVTCRCLRINPLTWETYIQLRFEVLGHSVP